MEERALKEQTGTFRYNQWVSETTQTSSVYPDRAVTDYMPTFRRVFEHREALAPAHWVTHNQATFQGPDRVGDLRTYVPEPETGTRGKIRAEALQKRASTVEAEPFPLMDGVSNYTGTHGESAKMEAPAQQLGRRVMQTQDLVEQVSADPTFLGESGIVEKSRAERGLADTGTATAPVPAPATTPYYLDEPITLYSQDRAEVDRKTFLRNTTFTTPMTEATKIVVNE